MRDNQKADNGQIIKQLVSEMQCPICCRQYRKENTLVLGHQDELWVLAVICRHCHTHGLVFAVVHEVEEQFASELVPQECLKFQEMPQIDMDDVLDIQRFLRDFDGDFKTLFSETR